MAFRKHTHTVGNGDSPFRKGVYYKEMQGSAKGKLRRGDIYK